MSMLSTAVNQIGTVGVVLFLFIVNVMLLQMVNWFLLFNLSYYNVSYRIQLLRSFLSASGGKAPIQRLRACGYIFDQISRASNELTSTFSFSVLVILTVLMFSSATCLFFGLFHLKTEFKSMKMALLLFSFVFIIFIIIIITAAESPISEVLSTDERKVN